MAHAQVDIQGTLPLEEIQLEEHRASIFIPEQVAPERWTALFVFLLTCSYLMLFRRFNALDPDEGIVLQGAQRILHGQVLYRDFFSFFTPGSYYFLALIFKLWGSSMDVARTSLVFIGGVCSGVTYLLARRVCTRRNALLAAGIVTLTALPFRFLVLHNWDSTLWASLALYCAVRLLDSQWWAWAWGAGSFTALTILFEQSKGTGLFLGLCAGVLILKWAGRGRLFFTKDQLRWCMAGFLWPFAVTLIFFATQHGLSPMWADWIWPLGHYSSANRVPYGYQNWSDSARVTLFASGPWLVRFLTALAVSPLLWIPALPLIAAGLGVYWGIRLRRYRETSGRCAYYVLSTATLTGLLLSILATRADVIHFIYLQPFYCLVLAWLFDGGDVPGRVYRAVRPLFTVLALAGLLALSSAILLRTVNAPVRMNTPRGAILLPAQDTVIPYTDAHVAPGETILVHPYLPLYYFLTGTFSPARYDYFQPGMHTAEQAREMISQIHAQRPRFALLEISFAEKIPTSWPSTPQSAIASDPVADYVLQNYRACRVLRSPRDWRFAFMVREDLACPSSPSLR